MDRPFFPRARPLPATTCASTAATPAVTTSARTYGRFLIRTGDTKPVVRRNLFGHAPAEGRAPVKRALTERDGAESTTTPQSLCKKPRPGVVTGPEAGGQSCDEDSSIARSVSASADQTELPAELRTTLDKVAQLAESAGTPWCLTGSTALLLWAKKHGTSLHRTPGDTDILIRGSTDRQPKQRDNRNRSLLTGLCARAANAGGRHHGEQGAGCACMARVSLAGMHDTHLDILVCGRFGSMQDTTCIAGYPVAGLTMLKKQKEATLKELEEDNASSDTRQKVRGDIGFIDQLLS